YAAAKGQDELAFAIALNPGFDRSRGPGWSTADEAIFAVEDYLAFLTTTRPSRVNVRIALGLYAQLGSASGFYEVPKNMLRTPEGPPPGERPFSLAPHDQRGAIAAREDLAGHASRVGRTELADSIRDAFNPRIVRGYANGEYVIWKEELRLPDRGDEPAL